jgi:hypothetical protein
VGKSQTPPGPRAREELAAYLVDNLGVREEELPKVGDWSELGQTIGTLALRLGALSLDQLDTIIDSQSCHPEGGKRFGEIASQLGFVSDLQVERLLQLQEFHRAFELGELLVLSDQLDLPQLCELMAGFLRALAKRTPG